MEGLQSAWLFFQDQILGMKWLNTLIGNLLNTAGLSPDTPLGGGVQFFIYDTIKIFILLSVLIFCISYIQSYFPPERTKRILGHFNGLAANTVSALLGTVTPFCSCSSIPLFMGFTGAGLPIGVTFSFLISSPMVDLGSLVLLMSIFGTRVAVVYVVLGLVVAIVGGTVLQKLGMERYVEDFIKNAPNVNAAAQTLTRRDRVAYARGQLVSTVKKSCALYFHRRRHWSSHSQRHPRRMGGGDSGRKQSAFRAARHRGGHSHVCRHFRHHSRGGKPFGKGRRAWHGAFVYDGSHHAESAFHDYAEKGGKAALACGVYCHLHGGHSLGRLLFQRFSRMACVMITQNCILIF